MTNRVTANTDTTWSALMMTEIRDLRKNRILETLTGDIAGSSLMAGFL